METIKQYKSTGFACYHGSIGSVLVKGPDAWDFLNRITTRKFSPENINESIPGALLTGKSEIRCLFQAWNRGAELVELFPLSGSYYYILEHLEEMRFSEKLVIEAQDKLMWVELRGDNIPYVKTNKVIEEEIGKKQILIIPMDNWGIPGVLLGATEVEDLMSVIKIQSLKTLQPDEGQMIEEYFGFPCESFFITRFQILEMGLDRFIDRNKGCYPGQEVVEKIYTYGKPAKKLVRITLKSNEEEIKKLSYDQDKALYADNLQVGHWCQLHMLDGEDAFGLAVVNRGVIEKALNVTFGPNGPQGKIELLT